MITRKLGRRVSTRRPKACLTLILGLGLTGLASSMPLQATTRSKAPIPASVIPDGSFETLITLPHERYPTNSAWTFSPGWSSGIASTNSGFVSDNNTTGIDGTQVAFLQNQYAYMETVVSVPQSGIYRIHLVAAPRIRKNAQNMVYLREHPKIEVLVNNERLAIMALREHEAPVDQFHPYVTRPFTVAAGNVTIRIAKNMAYQPNDDHTALIDDIRIEEIRAWGDTNTWSAGTVPRTSDHVLIEAGHTVGISGSYDVGGVEVLGELLASNSAGGLDSAFVKVSGTHGHFEVGREEVPFEDDFILTLTGDPNGLTPSGWNAGEKFLLVEGGALADFHGKHKTSWTRLAGTAAVGDTSISVEGSAEGWEPNDKLVIAGTVLKQEIWSEPSETSDDYVDYAQEVFLSTSSNPSALSLRAPIAGDHPHIGGPIDAVTTWSHPNSPNSPTTLDQSAEVGNLTRNVKIMGDAASQNAPYVGGHIMMRMDGDNGGKGRFSNVEFTQMGQAGAMGRYPIHFHMVKGLGQGSRVINCAIHETYNRAVTIHATDYVEFKDNVAYHNLGHAVFLEDGSEQENVIQRNLVLSTLRFDASPTIPSDNSKDSFRDRSPASFWITNPYNIVEDNVAAGTVGCGFWLIFPRTVHGPSVTHLDLMARTPPIRQSFMHDPVTDEPRFRGNVAHSCGLGLDVNDALTDLDPASPFFNQHPSFGDHPTIHVAEGVRTNCSWMPSREINGVREDITETILDFTAHTCGSGVYASTGGNRVRYEKLLVADSNICTDMAAAHRFEDCTFASSAKAHVIPHPQVGLPYKSFRQVAFKLYDGPAQYDNVAIHGFDVQNNPLWAHRGPAQAHPNEVFENVVFSTAPWLSSDNLHIFVDWPLTSETVVNANQVGRTYHNSVISNSDRFGPRKWGKTVLDKLGLISGSPGHSIVQWNPLLEAPGWVRYPHGPQHWPGNGSNWPTDRLEAGSDPTNLDDRQPLMVSPARYAQLRIKYATGPSYSLETVSTLMDLWINRRFPNESGGGTNEEVTYFHNVEDNSSFKQMPVVVEVASSNPSGRVEYTLDHDKPDFACNFNRIMVTQDNSLEGDIGWYWLEDLRGKDFNEISAMSENDQGTQVPVFETDDRQVADNAQVPCLFFERDASGVVQRVALRVYVRSSLGGSRPAGIPFSQRQTNPITTNLPEFGGSRDLDDSEWRSEKITIDWALCP